MLNDVNELNMQTYLSLLFWDKRGKSLQQPQAQRQTNQHLFQQLLLFSKLSLSLQYPEIDSKELQSSNALAIRICTTFKVNH